MSTKVDIANMPTVTLSTRLNPEEVQQLDLLAESSGSDRSSLLKSLVRKGMKELRMEMAVDAFRNEQATMSRAAEIAGVSLWDFVSRMKASSVELHYEVAEFEEDLAIFSRKS